jgi:hypothetical protein
MLLLMIPGESHQTNITQATQGTGNWQAGQGIVANRSDKAHAEVNT